MGMSQDDLHLPDDVEQLKAMIAGRDEAIAGQAVAIAERDEAISQHETVIAAQHETIEQQLRKLEGLHQQLARLLRKQYGPQKERIDPDQLTLFSAEELESLVAELQQGVTDSVSTDDGTDDDISSDDDGGEAVDPKRKPSQQGHGRRPLPDHLPREEVIHELTDKERTCPCCGKLRKEIGSEVSDRQRRFVGAAAPVWNRTTMSIYSRFAHEEIWNSFRHL